MKMNSNPSRRALPLVLSVRQIRLVLVGCGLVVASAAHAQSTYTWDGGSTTTAVWGNAANWVGDPTPSFVAGTTVNFYAPGAARLYNYIHTVRTIGTLNFTADADADVSIRLSSETGGNARVLTFDVASGSAAINVDVGATGNHTVGVANGSMMLNDNLIITHNGSGNLTLDRDIADDNDARSITKEGSGTLTLTPNSGNTFGGGFTLNAGRVRIGGGALGNAGIATLNGGTLSTAGSGNRNVNLNYVIGGNVTLGNAVDNGNLTFAGTGDLGSANRTLTIESYVSLGGAVSGTGGITKEGTAQLRLGGINNYAGATTINAGRLTIDGDNSAATGLVTVNSTGILSGSGTIGGAVTVNGNGTLAPGSSPGLLTLKSDLTLAGGSFFDWEFVGDTLGIRGTDYDGVNLSGGGNLNIGSGATLRLLGSGQDYSAAAWQSERLFEVIDLDTGTLSGSLGLDATGAGAFGSFGSWSVENQDNDVFVRWSVVPEPSTLTLLSLAGAALLARRCRRLAVK